VARTEAPGPIFEEEKPVPSHTGNRHSCRQLVRSGLSHLAIRWDADATGERDARIAALEAALTTGQHQYPDLLGRLNAEEAALLLADRWEKVSSY
jgi:hypothetical protein